MNTVGLDEFFALTS